MADLHILKSHSLGLGEARKVAFAWGELAEEELGMQCIYQQGDDEDELSFTGPGVKGLLWVSHDRLEIEVELGLFLRGFKSKIEKEIMKNIDLSLPEAA